MSDIFDVAFIGGGPGGYHAAVFAAKKGLKAAVVERAHLGGTCLNRGCIPTKVIHASAEMMHAATEGAKFGFVLEGTVRPDMAAVAARKDAIVRRLRDGVAGLFKGNGIALVAGTGRLAEGGVAVTHADGAESIVLAKHVVVATGSRPSVLSGIDADHEVILDSDDAVSLTRVPGSVVIIGGGVIGCEFADILNRFGAKVTIVEVLPRILSTEDPIVSRVVGKAFAARGITTLTGTSVTSVARRGDVATVTLADGKAIDAAAVLISVGRRPNTEGIGADDLRDHKGQIKVDGAMRTARPGVYAAGDCVGGLMLAHVASYEAEAAVKHMLGEKVEVSYDAVPGCVFTTPEVASVGLQEDAAKQRGIDVSLGRFYYQVNGQALALGDEDGQVKVVAERGSGRLIGAVIIGKGASSMIAELGLAVAHRMKASDLCEVIHAHPTLPEISLEAVADIDGMAIHKAGIRRK